MKRTTINNEVKTKMSEFAIACYNDNSISELKTAYRSTKADRADMKIWNITAAEWHAAIKSALAHKLNDSK